LPTSSSYAFQLSPATESWVPTFWTFAGDTHPRAGFDTVREHARADEVVEDLAVGLVFRVGRPAGDDRHVVVVALVASGVIVIEKRSLLGQRARQVWIGGGVADRRGVVLVLEHDQEHVADRRDLEAGAPAGSRATISAVHTTMTAHTVATELRRPGRSFGPRMLNEVWS
jgi:hypothetical protein